jgi:3',5'-cyclic AMP phosphodiesterase CpdA
MLASMRIAHLADFHLPAAADKVVNGVKPHANLLQAVEAVRKQTPAPELIVLGGDLLDNGEHESYQAVADVFGDLQAPVHLVLGNHDSLPGLRKTWQPAKAPDFPGYYSFDFKGLHIVILNSSVAGKEFGRLDERQLLWLSEDLHQSNLKPVLIFLHHPPFDTGISWLDKVKLANVEGFWEIIPPFAQNILGVFSAHLHLQHTCTRRGVLAAGTPAVSWQFSGNADAARAALSSEPPGFNLIDVHDRRLAVRTVRFPLPRPVEPPRA